MKRLNRFRFWTLAALVLVLTLALPWGALADNVQNDVVVGGNDTFTLGGTTTVSYRITANNGDGQTGCNASDGSPAVVTINTPPIVTAFPNPLTFTACSTSLPTTFTASSAGNYEITVSVSDSGTGSYNTNPAKFTLHVLAPTNTAPTLSLPGNITEEGNTIGGANVSYSASASDAEDGSLTPLCNPASGSFFPLGTTTVNCSVTDSGELFASGSFNVTVVDTTPPVLTLPSDITAEATGPSGAAVSYSASASDLVDGPVAVSCSPASGSTFALGTTTVNCSASDSHGNTASGSFDVTVVDTTPPVLTLPADMTAWATGPSGAVVSYSASASDIVDGAVAVSCLPVSGSTFTLGTTTVGCSASDSHGNTANGSFKVTVIYNWNGFFRPVDNLPTLNSVKAGSAIPVKFSLSGNQGLNIFASGYPKSAVTPCDSTAPVDAIEDTVTAGGSSLSYDPSADQYNYVWKTDKSWTGCRQLVVKLIDGTEHRANFKFTK